MTHQQLRSLPPIVSVKNITSLKERLGKAQRGNGLVYICGAPPYGLTTEKTSEMYARMVENSLGMSFVTGKNVTPILRGGQYSSDMMLSYFHSAVHVNHLNNLSMSGMYDIDLSEIEKYREVLTNVKRSVEFSTALGRHYGMYVTHESSHLPFDKCFVRDDACSGSYLGSTHLPWIGVDVLDSPGHLEVYKKVQNPILLEVTENSNPSTLVKLFYALNPSFDPDKIVFLFRLGTKLGAKLPHILKLTKNLPYTTMIDPGSAKEVRDFISICRDESVYPSGMYCAGRSKDETLEMTFHFAESLQVTTP